MLLLLLNAVAVMWITYRVLFQREFLLWNWQDGTLKYVWNAHREDDDDDDL